jgi:hypothetical protein
MRTAYIKADAKLLAPKGTFGMGACSRCSCLPASCLACPKFGPVIGFGCSDDAGERGVGGSKCGATAATAIVFKVGHFCMCDLSSCVRVYACARARACVWDSAGCIDEYVVCIIFAKWVSLLLSLFLR